MLVDTTQKQDNIGLINNKDNNMKTLILLVALVPASVNAAAIYRCGNLYTDDVKLCANPVTLSINAAPPQTVDPTRTCQPATCTITKENK